MIASFGEIMMRLNPEGYRRLVQADRLEMSFAGGEANVSVSLANYGEHAAFITMLPSHEIGNCAVNALRKYGVDVSRILRGGERLGVYFVEKGASQRGSKVIYDRAGSAISRSRREDYDWAVLLKDVEWFHFTGITPALGGVLPEICMDAVRQAKKQGAMISCDLNYRSKLWTREQAGRVMGELMPYADVCIANEEDAKDVFGIEASNSDVEGGTLSRDGYIDVARQLTERFSLKCVAITLRGSISASDNRWSGLLYDGDRSYFSRDYLIHIVDRVGGGDSFAGGLIHAMRKWPDKPQKVIEFAAAASCLKQTIEQDFNLVTEQEVLALMEGKGSGRVQR